MQDLEATEVLPPYVLRGWGCSPLVALIALYYMANATHKPEFD